MGFPLWFLPQIDDTHGEKNNNKTLPREKIVLDAPRPPVTDLSDALRWRANIFFYKL